MQAAFQNNCYEFHYNRNGYKFWKCVHHRTGCQAKIVSKDGAMYPLDLIHNHEVDDIELVPTKDIRHTTDQTMPSLSSTTVVPAEKQIKIESNIILKSGSDAPKPVIYEVGGLELKNKLKERFEAISKKLSITKQEKK